MLLHANLWFACILYYTPEIFYHIRLMEVVSGPLEASQHYLDQTSKDDILDLIYINLTGRRIEEAAELAEYGGFPQLSIILTTFSVDRAKEFLSTQINIWKRSGAIKHINEKLLKIYLLLAGVPVCGDTNVCAGLEWVRAFAIHVWYASPNSQTLGDAVDLYEKAYRETKYAPVPIPPYYKGGLPKPPTDLFYELILLFTKKHTTLKFALNPATYTDNMGDYRLSWFLLQVLTSLNVGRTNDSVKNYICINFASQLEQLNLWQYAIFVLLFITNTAMKKHHVDGILYRNLPDDLLEPENAALKQFLVRKLRIPRAWIHAVLADKCRWNGDSVGEFYNSFYSGRFNQAQAVCVEKIIPTLITNRQYITSMDVLRQLEPADKLVQNYKYSAGLLLAILRLTKTINTKKNVSAEERMEYRETLRVFARGLKSFKIKNPEQGLCIAEISKCCAVLLYTIYKKDEKYKEQDVTDLNGICQNVLQMPPDYKGTELELLSSDILDVYHPYFQSSS